MSGLEEVRGGGCCLARATAFVILAAATAETLFEESLVVFFTPPDCPDLAWGAFEPVLLDTEQAREVVFPTLCLLAAVGRTLEGGVAAFAGDSASSLQ